MKRWIVMTMVLLASAGCNSNPPEARVEAYKRWHQTRARIVCSVALQHLKVGQLDQARNKAQEALALDEKFVKARLLLGKVYIEQGNYVQAVAELSQACWDEPESAEAFYLLGVAHEKAGRSSEAVGSYRRAYALDNSDIAPVVAAAEVLAASGRIAEAQLYIDSYINVAGPEPAIFELGGRLAMMREEYGKAAGYYQQAHDLDYKNLRYQEALGRSEFLAGKFAEAVEILTKLTKTKDYTAAAWIYTMLGDCFMAAGRLQEARDSYRIASELRPSAPAVWMSLAGSAMKMDDISAAILSARQALFLEADHLDAMLLLGYALLRDGRFGEAIGTLKRANTVHPHNATLQCVLGRAHAAAGDDAQAVRYYLAALRLEPDSQLARELLGAAGVENNPSGNSYR